MRDRRGENGGEGVAAIAHRVGSYEELRVTMLGVSETGKRR